MIILFNYCTDMKNYESFKGFRYIYIYIMFSSKEIQFPLFYRINLFLLLLFFNNSIVGRREI